MRIGDWTFDADDVVCLEMPRAVAEALANLEFEEDVNNEFTTAVDRAQGDARSQGQSQYILLKISSN